MHKFKIGKTYSELGRKNYFCYPVKITKIEHKKEESYITVTKTYSPIKTEYTTKIEQGFISKYKENKIIKSQYLVLEDEYGRHPIWACDEIKED